MTAPYGTAYIRVLADVSKFPEDLRKKMQEGVDKASKDQKWDEFEHSAEGAGERAGKKAGEGLAEEAEKETRSGSSKHKMEQAGENAAKNAGGGFLTKLRSIVLGRAGLYGVLGAAAAGILGSAQSLVPATLAAIPALAGAAAGSILTLVLAMHGFSAAIGAGLAGNTEKFNKALEGLAPAAQKVAKEIVGLKGAFTGLQQTVQQAFFAQLIGDFQGLAHKLLPILKAQLPGLAGTLGGLFGSLLGGIGDSAGPIGTILSYLNNGLKPFLPVLHDMVTTFFKVGAAAAPFLEALSKVAAADLGKFLDGLNKSLGSGGITKFFEEAGNFLASLGGPLGSLLGLVGDILDAFSTLGSPTLAFIGTLAETLRTVLAPLLPPLAKFLSTVLGQAGKLLVALTPGLTAIAAALGDFFTALGDQLPGLGEALTPLLDSLSQLVVAIAPDLSAYLVGLATNIIPILIDVLKAMLPWWQELTPLWVKLAQEILPEIGPLMKAWFQVFADLVPLIPDILNLFEQFLPLVEEIIPLIPQFLELWTGMLEIFDQLLPLIIPLIGYVLKFFAAWDNLVISDIVIPQLRAIIGFIDGVTTAVDKLLTKLGLLNGKKLDTRDKSSGGIGAAGRAAAAAAAAAGGSSGYIPYATGGMAWHPTRALIGENEPEAVIPMGSPDKARRVAQSTGLLSMIGSAGSGAWTVNVYLGTRDLTEFTDKRVEAKMDEAAGSLAGAR